MKGTGAVLILALAIAACGRSSPPASHVAAAAQPEAQRLDAALDRLEQRLLASQANVALWAELRGRHEDVSAVTCRNLSEHARAVAVMDERQHDRRSALRKNRVATRFDPTALNRR